MRIWLRWAFIAIYSQALLSNESVVSAILWRSLVLPAPAHTSSLRLLKASALWVVVGKGRSEPGQ